MKSNFHKLLVLLPILKVPSASINPKIKDLFIISKGILLSDNTKPLFKLPFKINLLAKDLSLL